MPEVLAVVQARGGSKSIPNKNIKNLAGIPLVAYSIAAGLQAETVTRTIISTDSPEIAAIAREWGAEAPFLRPAELATDDALDLDLFIHALEWLKENENYQPDIIVQLRPTTPFRPVTCVDDAVRILQNDPQADSVRGVVRSGQNPYKMWRIPQPGEPMQPLMKDEFDEPYNMPRQQLPQTYWQTGHIDAIRYETIMDKRSMTGSRILPYILDSIYTIDIDTELDWDRAEWMLSRLNIPMIQPVQE